LLVLFGAVELNGPMIETIESAGRLSKKTMPYFKLLGLLLSYTDSTIRTLDKSALLSALSFGTRLPSANMKALTVVEYLLKGNQAGWTLFEQLTSSVFELVNHVRHEPFFDVQVTAIFKAFITKIQAPHPCVPQICRSLFMSLPSTPSFHADVSLIPLLHRFLTFPDPNYEEFVRRTEALSFQPMVSYSKWLIAHEQREKRKAEAVLMLVNSALKNIIQWPFDDNLVLLIDAITAEPCDVGSAFIQVWKLLMVRFPEIKVLLLLHWLRKSAPRSNSQSEGSSSAPWRDIWIMKL
jgi:hypothetical protein